MKWHVYRQSMKNNHLVSQIHTESLYYLLGHHFDDGDISFFDGIHKRSNQLSQLELFINYQWRNINSSYVQMNG